MSRTSLTRFAHMMNDADPAGPRRAAKELWGKHGIVVLFPEQMKAMAGLERELIQAIANKQYGKTK